MVVVVRGWVVSGWRWWWFLQWTEAVGRDGSGAGGVSWREHNHHHHHHHHHRACVPNHRFLTLMIIGGSLGRIGKAAERGLRGSRLHRGGQCCVLVAGTGLALQEQTREQETKCEVCPMMQFCTLVAGAMAVLSLHTPGSGRRRAA